MVISLIALLFIVISVEAISEIITSADIFTEVRGWFSRQENFVLRFIFRIISCGYCCSVWVSGCLAWALPFTLTGYWFINIVIYTFAVHRMANWYHEYMSRWFGRHPWTCVIHKVGKR